MRLPDFILGNTESILTEWDTFARSIWPRSAASPKDLRDHAAAILRATARDMKTPQTGLEQSEKSKGWNDAEANESELTVASGDHALGRAESGFDLRAVMAEYRALRASVVRLWQASLPRPDNNDLADLTRFHEAMDQSLSEAVCQYSDHVDKSRQMFLRILGHDLRTPLSAIGLLAQCLAETRPEDSAATEIASQILSSSSAIDRMLNDFLDIAASRLGQQMPVNRASMDLAELCREVVAEVRSSNPHCKCSIEGAGELRGDWDRARLRQLLSNLLGNAVQHGDPTSGIAVSLRNDGSIATLSVHNHGEPIPGDLLPQIFEPFVRGSNSKERNGSVGLGLYIAREVALAHGGLIRATSTQAGGTTLTVALPLRSKPAP